MANGRTDLRGALERGVKELREGLTEVLEEAEAASRIAILKMEALNLETDRDRALRDLGRAVHERAQAAPGAPIPQDGDVGRLLEEVRKVQDAMEAKRREREDLKARRGWKGPPEAPEGAGAASSTEEAAKGGGAAQAP